MELNVYTQASLSNGFCFCEQICNVLLSLLYMQC